MVNNNKVNVGAVLSGINNREEINMKNINNSVVKNEWVEKIEEYVKVSNARTFESMLDDGTIINRRFSTYGGNAASVEDIELEDGCLITIIKMVNLIISDNPKIKKGLRVMIHDAEREKLADELYLTVDGNNIGRDEVDYELKIDESVKIGTNKKGERYMVNVKNNEVELDVVKVITIGDNYFINESQLWETIGDPHYTLPLIYVIENVITSMVDNEELDEEVIDHTNEIIMKLINKGEFVYIVKDGELQEVEGVSTEGIEAVELYIPYLLELEKAADELWGFCKVVGNIVVRDEDKNEMMSQILADELYSFVYLYCREVWWDGGSN